VHGAPTDHVLAWVDDYQPTAIEERDDGVRIFFQHPQERDRARRAIGLALPAVTATELEVDDEDWARRSQADLGAVTVGRLTIAPPWAVPPASAGSGRRRSDGLAHHVLVIEPSTGFGTGHHASTRLCLKGLQTLDLRGSSVIDIGTGSGVLALAARVLGAWRADGIDTDPDAVASATRNLALNPAITNVAFGVADLTAAAFAPADIVTANLTGALLVRAMSAILRLVRPGGSLIMSGILADERSAVVAASAPAWISWEQTEDEWVGLAVRPLCGSDGNSFPVSAA
jgi:ribosomal protein L11 methyltransferase